MLQYPALFEPEGKFFVVTFRDIPEAVTQGDGMDEARAMAQDALISSMDFYFEDKRQVPAPSALRDGERLVSLPASVSAKVLLLNELLASGVRPAELARRMGTTPQEVNRVIDLHHATKIDTLAAALAALGKQLRVSVG